VNALQGKTAPTTAGAEQQPATGATSAASTEDALAVQQARIDERQKYQDALDANLDLAKARLQLLRALGHMDDWLQELHANHERIRAANTNDKIKRLSLDGRRRLSVRH